mmetsp:Transcript_25641/g.71496  ORF Transcript_25641/g.71496 Transcript_25641/m.71496 type:complete len:433 (+) Transcript_25641:138-1436(+)
MDDAIVVVRKLVGTPRSSDWGRIQWWLVLIPGFVVSCLAGFQSFQRSGAHVYTYEGTTFRERSAGDPDLPTKLAAAPSSAAFGWKQDGARKKVEPHSLSFPADSPNSFERQAGVVIATKIHGLHQQVLLDQSLCLLHHAYNHRPLYDILVFMAEPLSEEAQKYIQSLVAPAKVTVVVDNRGFQEEIAALSPQRRKNFLLSCNVSDPATLTWWSNCPGRVAYNWQAEFRSWQIWRHPALAPYRSMDSDGFPTKPWPQDPIKIMVENSLVILFDHWRQGSTAGADVTDRILRAFGVHLCSLGLTNGTLRSRIGPGDGSGCRTGRIPLIHGFFHITNLDFFRSDAVQKFSEIWIGDGYLQRRFDDQAAVTIPAAILAPNRSWEMRLHGICLDIYHNMRIDGQIQAKPARFLRYWGTKAKQQLPSAAGVCPIKAGA